MSPEIKVPMSSPDLTDLEREAVARVLRTPNLSMGGEILAFEEAFRQHSGRKHAIGVNSGTAGLHLCVRAAGVGEDDLVITTPFSFVASANVLLFEHAVPVFVDVDPTTGNIDPQGLREAVIEISNGGEAGQAWLPRRGYRGQGKLKAVLPVDVFGQPADYDPIRKVAQEHGLKIIEDSCEALGAEYKGRKAGTLGDMGVYAFYPNKQITTGEGGLIVTDDDQAADLMRALRNQGRAPGDTWLQHTHLGYNYRLDEMSAALGKVQMGRLDELQAKRQQVADWYNERVAEIPGVEAPQVAASTTAPFLVRLRGALCAGSRPRPHCRRPGRERHPGATVFPADPPAALHGRAIRLPGGRFSGHGRPGTARSGAALFRRDERGTGRPGVPDTGRDFVGIL